MIARYRLNFKTVSRSCPTFSRPRVLSDQRPPAQRPPGAATTGAATSGATPTGLSPSVGRPSRFLMDHDKKILLIILMYLYVRYFWKRV
ncbi:unnamed protein product [Lactuca virosa]|uniref:Uncharacterized protein n=1 Tax=Lactuca virosa TaxID=75947 RepID=A0AAU9N9S7_9ASTR|nr:unnamed protein product [Lactuca virosa]